MTGLVQTEMALFHQRHDRNNRMLFVAALSAGLALSAINTAHGVPGAIAAGWLFGIVLPPLFVLAWWGAMELIARWRDGRPIANPDDARSGMRIANAGFAFNVALMAAVLGTQATVTLAALGSPVGDLIPRTTLIAVGAATILLGNVWPRLPAARAMDGKGAAEMRVNRLWGWLMVIIGLLCVTWGLFALFFHPWPDHRP